MEERCIICGQIIPEGRMVCPACEAAAAQGETPAPPERTCL